jgi:hypothetical protein
MGARGIALLLVVGVSVAGAQPKPKGLEGASEVHKLTTASGFIDDAVAVDGDRFAFLTRTSPSCGS